MNGFFLNIFFDRINRMDWIFSRFPGEIVKIAITLTAKRIAYLWFLPETANLKYPNDPVNPV
jgi:hypothetical protein